MRYRIRLTMSNLTHGGIHSQMINNPAWPSPPQVHLGPNCAIGLWFGGFYFARARALPASRNGSTSPETAADAAVVGLSTVCSSRSSPYRVQPLLQDIPMVSRVGRRLCKAAKQVLQIGKNENNLFTQSLVRSRMDYVHYFLSIF